MKDKIEKITPFSCGTDYYEVWHPKNCSNCKKYNENVDKTCKLEYELSLALIDDGLIKKSTLKKINKNATKYLNCFNCEQKE